MLANSAIYLEDRFKKSWSKKGGRKWLFLINVMHSSKK